MTTLRCNMLSMPQAFKVGEYLHKIEEKLKGERPSFRKVAEWATEALGFRVTEHNVMTVAEASCVTWGPPDKASNSRLRGRIAQQLKEKFETLATHVEEEKKQVVDLATRLKEAVATLEKEIQVLRENLQHLYGQLGEIPLASLNAPVSRAKVTKVAG